MLTYKELSNNFEIISKSYELDEVIRELQRNHVVIHPTHVEKLYKCGLDDKRTVALFRELISTYKFNRHFKRTMCIGLYRMSTMTPELFTWIIQESYSCRIDVRYLYNTPMIPIIVDSIYYKSDHVHKRIAILLVMMRFPYDFTRYEVLPKIMSIMS